MDTTQPSKEHRAPRAGAKAKKKKATEKKKKGNEQAKGQNPRAFIFKSSSKARKARTVAAEKQQRKLRAPIMDRTGEEPPPFVVLVQGPPGCGKSTVIRSLVKHYTRHALSEVKGPITVVSGKKRRIQFMEVSNDLNDMVDAAKLADLVLLLVDGSYGFEMETFEFLNILQVHGFPKVMGVLTHLDEFHDPKKLKKQKKTLKSRFWSEIYNGKGQGREAGGGGGVGEVARKRKFIFPRVLLANAHPGPGGGESHRAEARSTLRVQTSFNCARGGDSEREKKKHTKAILKKRLRRFDAKRKARALRERCVFASLRRCSRR